MFVVEMAEEATETGDTVEEVKDEKVEEEMEREAEEAVPGIIRSGNYIQSYSLKPLKSYKFSN